MFQSKQHACDNIHIDHRILNNYLHNNKLYLSRFMFSIELISEIPSMSLISLESLSNLIQEKQGEKREIQVKSKKIYAEKIRQPSLSKIYNSIGSFTKAVNGDQTTIRSYINKNEKSLYRKEWKLFIIQDEKN